MRRKIRWAMVLSAILYMFQIVAYAGVDMNTNISSIDGAKMFSSENMARILGTPRGRLISSVEVSITDKGNGTVGLFADVLCHEPMKQIKMNLYLQIWSAEDEMWTTVETYKFTWDTEDNPNEELTMAAVAFDATGLERGRDYRLRIIAGAYNLDSSYSEAWRSETTAIQVQ